MRKVKKYLRLFLLRVLQLIPSVWILRLLFRLENWLYYLEGQAAIAYGNGIHPKHKFSHYHHFFIEHIHPGERVLDVGCGAGILAYDLAQQSGAQVFGIDINPQNIEQALKRFAHVNIQYQVGDVLTDLPEKGFDVVILSNVLEHLPNRPAFLMAIQANNHPSRFLIRVPLFERDWRVALKKELGIDYRLDPTHQIEYTLESFADEIKQARLQVSSQEVRWGEIWAEAIPICG